MAALGKQISKYLRDTMGSVPGHCNKANSAIKQVTLVIWFPYAYRVTFILC